MEQQNNQVNADTAIILVATALLAPFMLPAAILLTFAKADTPIKKPTVDIKQKQICTIKRPNGKQQVNIFFNSLFNKFESLFNKLACAYRNVD